MRVINSIFFFLLMVTMPAMAQNVMTSSPYSMFGVGEIVTGLYGQNSSMGGVSLGMRNPMLINTENPAGLVGIDSCKLLAETSAFAKWESYYSKGSSNDAFTGNLSSFALAGRIRPRWYMAAGLNPYSSVGYYFQSGQPLEGSPGTTYYSVFEGSGGLSKIYLSNAFALSPHLSLGVNLNFIFGNIKQSETQSAMSVTQQMYGRSFYADFGLQYHCLLNRDLSLTLGTVYGYRQKITLDNTLVVTDGTNETERKQKKINQYLPQFVGLGGSLGYKKWTYALDYKYHQYSSMVSDDSRISYHNAHELRAGVSYYPNGYSSKSYWKRITYKAGVGVSTSYLHISDNPGIGWRASLGMGLPVMNGLVNASFFYDCTQLQNNALQKNVAGFTVTYTISELFYKLKL